MTFKQIPGALAVVALAGGVGCGSGEEDGPYELVVQPEQIQFGNVVVPTTQEAILTLRSSTGQAFELDSVTMRPLDQLTFGFTVMSMSAPQDGAIEIGVAFHPVGPGGSSIELVIVPKGAEPKIILVSGTGVQPADVRVMKQTFDFGTIPVGSSDMIVSSIENRNATPGTVTFAPGLNVDHCDAMGAEENTFCVVFTGKTLDSNQRFSIEGNENIPMVVRFIPLEAMVTERASFDLLTCGTDDCKVTVQLTGVGG